MGELKALDDTLLIAYMCSHGRQVYAYSPSVGIPASTPSGGNFTAQLCHSAVIWHVIHLINWKYTSHWL